MLANEVEWVTGDKYSFKVDATRVRDTLADVELIMSSLTGEGDRKCN